jgi:hypothetical protein
MSKDKLLNLVKHVVNAVRFAMPIGSYNFRATETILSDAERTGGWSEKLGECRRFGGGCTIGYERVTKNKWKEKWYIDNNLALPYTQEQYSDNEVRDINWAIYSELGKVGNCSFMCSLAMIYLCQFAKSKLQEIPFTFMHLGIDGLDHSTFRIDCYGYSAICDPWLGIASLIEPHGQGIKELETGLISQGLLSKDEEVNDSSQAWLKLKKCFTDSKDFQARYIVNNHSQVNRLLDLYEKRYHQFIEQNITKNIYKNDDTFFALKQAKNEVNKEIQQASLVS